VKRLLAILLVTAVAGIGGLHASAPAASAAPATAAHACSSGWTHAVIAGAHKCLRAGQFCARAHDGQYRRYGYRCTKFDARANRYRLTR
jgi:hypothetical protein